VYNLKKIIYLGVFMERMTIKAYAVKHKLSMFNVMKMIKAGEIKSEVFHEKGREVTYILIDDAKEKEISEKIIPIEQKQDFDLKQEMFALKKELKRLQEEVEVLKKKILKE